MNTGFVKNYVQFVGGFVVGERERQKTTPPETPKNRSFRRISQNP